MDIVWSKAQRNAIDTRDRTLLVSAAAGSGKTAVLTERITESLCARDNPADLNRMLIATFTKAAAAELRARIASSLSEALKNDPTNRHLARQLSCLPTAKISTVDSLCYDIVKKNFEKLDIPYGSRVGDGAEIKLLKSKVMDDMFDSMYSGEDKEAFTIFTDAFIKDSDDKLPETFISLFDRLNSYSDGVRTIDKIIERMDAERGLPFFKTCAGSFLKKYLGEFINTYYDSVVKYTDYFDTSSKSGERYAYVYADMKERLDALREALAYDDYRGACAAFATYEHYNMSGTKPPKDPEADTFKALLTIMRDHMTSIKNDYLCYSDTAIESCMKTTAGVLRMLGRLMAKFDEEYSSEKRRRRLLDYADIEHLTLQLLCDGDSPTDFALELGRAYDEIYLDEYQDINDLQDKIFRMLAAGGAKRFMVGDIKQSIYGFRGAQPSIFAGYRDSFPAFNPDGKDSQCTVFLSSPLSTRTEKTVSALYSYLRTIGAHVRWSNSAMPFSAAS